MAAKRKKTAPKRDYCGCCGADIGPESGNLEPWCSGCRKHVGTTGQAYMRTYFALHGVECPLQVAEEGDW